MNRVNEEIPNFFFLLLNKWRCQKVRDRKRENRQRRNCQRKRSKKETKTRLNEKKKKNSKSGDSNKHIIWVLNKTVNKSQALYIPN